MSKVQQREIERLRRELSIRNGNTHPGYFLGQHWLSVAYERICAGDDEADVMADYGYYAKTDPVLTTNLTEISS